MRRSLVVRSFALGLAGSLSLAFAACGGGGGNPGAGNTALVKLTTASIANATTGVAYSQQFAADFPHAPGIFVVTGGSIPVGLLLDKVTGQLSGYPRQVGTFTFQLAARDGVDLSIPLNRDASFAEDRKTFSMTVADGPPNILPQQPPAAQYRASYSYQIDVAGGTAPYSFSPALPGQLPAGLSISPTGVLSSFPTQALQHPYTFQVTVTDAIGRVDIDTLTVDVIVLPLIILTPSPVAPAALGFAYDVPLDLASSGAGQPITWSQKLPLAAGEVLLSTIGMEIANSSGTGRFRVAAPNLGPTLLGTHLFTAQVVDEASQTATRQYSFTVSNGPLFTSISPNKAVLGAPITITGNNFQPGAVVIFKPGLTQVQVTPSSQTVNTLVLNTLPASPGGGQVAVRVRNPDGGFADKLSAYTFPAAALTFSNTPIFPSPNSPLSSTGLSVGDINQDGFADFVHCGSNQTWRNASGNATGVDLMINTPPGGVWNNATPTFARTQLDASADWWSVKLADIDADNDLDVVAIGNQGVRVWRNPFPAAFVGVTPTTSPLNSPSGNFSAHIQDLAVGRITSDGLPDIAYTQPDLGQFATYPIPYPGGRVSTMTGSGAGTFSSLQAPGTAINNSASASGVAIIDQGPGNRGNIVVTDSQAGFQSYWNGAGLAGDVAHHEVTNASNLFGTWTAMGKGGAGQTEALCAALGDINGDGISDIVIPSSAVNQGAVQAVFGFIRNGTTFTAVQSTAGSAGNERYAVVADLDFDAILDCAVTVATNRVDFFKGRSGTLGLQFRSSIQVTTNSPVVGRIGAGDFDNDGRNDVCVCMSFLADNPNQTPNLYPGSADRGIGGQQGVFILLNTSN